MEISARTDRNDFLPPPEPAAPQSFGLALLAHALLLAALAWGINWQSQPETAGVEAELWSAMPQEAAPPPPP
ncbi:protein TolA, partial [Ramlibacter aquaticus]|nr:protein TolA [Ramlibacter aquaticus]